MAIDATHLKAALADRYDVDREIGRGGMATVYLADDVRHRRHVAIKVLHPELAAVLGAERFLREIEIAAGLQHPHILPLYDSGQADTSDGSGALLFYVMPFIEGESLRDRLRRESQLSVDDALQIAREVADGLGYAHSLGIIHRDIKPENILMSNGHALIADFGIARAVREAGGERLTETGLSLGTPQYMSPEQASGSPNIDARSDVYALGCVTYEMLVGEPPHTGPNPQAIMAKVLTQPVPHVREARDTVSVVMDGTIAKALAKLPADRFATAQQFGEALQQSLTSDAVPSVATVATSRPRWQWPAVATLAVVVLGALALWGPWRGGGSPPASTGVLHLTMETEPLAVLQHVPSSVVRWSPDGAQLAYVAGQGPVGQIYLRRLDGTTTAVPGAAGAQAPFFSPDGRWLGFVSGGKLRKVSLVDGSGATLSDAQELHGADWNQHGTIVLGGNYGNLWGLSLVSSDGGAQEQLLSVPGATNSGAPNYYLYPTWLPDGRAVLFTTADAGGIAMDISVVGTSSMRGTGRSSPCRSM
jgi:serine/threonine-protein kinase